MTQLDGVDCTIDSKMWEWERVDPLGSTLPGDFDQGLSETDKVSAHEFVGSVIWVWRVDDLYPFAFVVHVSADTKNLANTYIVE